MSLTSPPNWDYRLFISALPQDASDYEDSFNIDLAPIKHWGLSFVFADKLQVRVRASKHGARIVVDIDIKVTAELPCSRCLENAAVPIEGTLNYIFRLGRAVREDEQDVEDIIELDKYEDYIELGDMIWETLIVSLPSAVHCTEDCQGLCPECGINKNKGECSCSDKNIDHRFAALAFLRKEE